MGRAGKAAGMLLGGGAIGAANGLLGGGGGMIAVPLLGRLGYPPRTAHATAIALVLPASVVSGAIYFLSGLTPWTLLVPVSLGTAFGGLVGAKLLNRLPVGAVTVLFAAVMLAAGVRMLF